ncbi:MAG TPA: class III extradiol ring-cleavage dioxygenase [Thermoanaerobaculia bacterium]|nr:class III extradiol ring-cleavage dioxygenase [Thermoanaerobaculia bacterium]
MNHSMPSLFISHGAPSIAIEQDDFTRAVASFGETVRDARAIAVVSAHWQARTVRVNAVAHPETIYDFGGFSPELYKIRYEAPGDPSLAREISTLLGGAALEETRGWDHGLWVPMRILLPEANVPIVEIAQAHPTTPADLLRIGQALAPLRDRGVVIAGSGGIVHNLRAIHLADKNAQVDDWANEFDDWFAHHLAARDFDTLARYRDLAPHANLAVPTPEHFEPVFVALGASRATDSLRTIYEGFHYGNLSMRTFALSA